MKASDKKIKREEPLSVELMIATVSQNDDSVLDRMHVQRRGCDQSGQPVPMAGIPTGRPPYSLPLLRGAGHRPEPEYGADARPRRHLLVRGR